MTSLSRRVLLTCLFPFAAHAEPIGDVYGALLRYSATQTHPNPPFVATAQGTPALLDQLLVTPSSLYSDLVDQPIMTNEAWWPDLVRQLAPTDGNAHEAVLAALQRQLGLTKARPGVEVFPDQTAVADYRGREAAANAMKAGVDPDLFWKARNLNGGRITVAAGEAVALQILREQIASTPEHLRTLMDVRPGVLSRYLQRQNAESFAEADQRYLGNLLRRALQRVDDAHIPTTYRVARVAAAYNDALGYYSSEGYCRDDAPRPGLPVDASALDDHAPLCFIAATDRGVRAWFERQVRLETSGVRIHEVRSDRFSRIAMWLGVLTMLGEAVVYVEALEAHIAEEFLGDGTLAEEDTVTVVDRPICRSTLP